MEFTRRSFLWGAGTTLVGLYGLSLGKYSKVLTPLLARAENIEGAFALRDDFNRPDAIDLGESWAAGIDCGQYSVATDRCLYTASSLCTQGIVAFWKEDWLLGDYSIQCRVGVVTVPSRSTSQSGIIFGDHSYGKASGNNILVAKNMDGLIVVKNNRTTIQSFDTGVPRSISDDDLVTLTVSTVGSARLLDINWGGFIATGIDITAFNDGTGFAGLFAADKNGGVYWWDDFKVASGLGMSHGPLVGEMTPVKGQIWARGNQAANMRVEYDTDPLFSAPQTTDLIAVDASSDLTGKVSLTNLLPDTLYSYRVIFEDLSDPSIQSVSAVKSFRTFSPLGSPANFSFVFGSCHSRESEDFSSFSSIALQSPKFLLLLGDNGYHDAAEEVADFQFGYRIILERPEFQAAVEQIPTMAIWDDHDSGMNNGDMTNFKLPAAGAAFKDYWANPRGTIEGDFRYYTFNCGRAQLWMLDVRRFRTPAADPDGPAKTMLGEKQKRWLRNSLKNSSALIKFVVSPVPFRNGIHFEDDWESYVTERTDLFSLFSTISGKVILLSGDQHFSMIINHEEGFKEISSSGLTGGHEESAKNIPSSPDIEFLYSGGPNFALANVVDSDLETYVEVSLYDKNNTWIYTTRVDL